MISLFSLSYVLDLELDLVKFTRNQIKCMKIYIYVGAARSIHSNKASIASYLWQRQIKS
jgi:hypothetical protein